jgi:predicted dehydrogenase
MVAAREIGTLRRVQVDYAQDWLAEPLEQSGVPGALWRTDPARAGAIGDIGTHAFNLAGFVTGEEPTHLLADLTSFVPGRRLDDDAAILLRYASGAKGMIWARQITVGNGSNLSLRVYGRRGGLEWRDEGAVYLAAGCSVPSGLALSTVDGRCSAKNLSPASKGSPSCSDIAVICSFPSAVRS